MKTNTPTPWSLNRAESGAIWNIGDSENDIALCMQIKGDDIKQSIRSANAAFIVRAVNSHEELLLVAKGFRAYLKIDGTDSKELNEIIAKAEGK